LFWWEAAGGEASNYAQDERFGGPQQPATLFALNLSPTQQKLWHAVEAPRSLDELSAWTRLPVHTLQADLTMLEIRGSIKRRGGLFVRAKSGG